MGGDWRDYEEDLLVQSGSSCLVELRVPGLWNDDGGVIKTETNVVLVSDTPSVVVVELNKSYLGYYRRRIEDIP